MQCNAINFTMHTVICELVLLATRSCKWLHACTDGPQATNVCGQSIHYLRLITKL